MTDSPTDIWLARLRALEPTERAALLGHMSAGELEMVLLRTLAELEQLERKGLFAMIRWWLRRKRDGLRRWVRRFR